MPATVQSKIAVVVKIWFWFENINTHNPGTDMMVVCLSGSLIISDTLM